MVQKVWSFYWRGLYCLLVELHWERCAPAACAVGLFFIMFPKHRYNLLFSHKTKERLFLWCLRFLFPNSDFTIFAVSERSLNKANSRSKENCCIGLQTFCYCRHIYNFCAIKDHFLNTICFCQYIYCFRFAWFMVCMNDIVFIVIIINIVYRLLLNMHLGGQSRYMMTEMIVS